MWYLSRRETAQQRLRGKKIRERARAREPEEEEKKRRGLSTRTVNSLFPPHPRDERLMDGEMGQV